MRDNRLIIVLALILVVGFIGINLQHYRASSEAVRELLVRNTLPLTSNNIYSEIQASLLRPIYVSSLMAHDTFLVDWMTDGEQELDKVTRYLRKIQQEYEVFSTFVVSAATRRYYHHDGVLKEVSPEVAKDHWFFSMRDHPQGYRVDIDANEAADHRLTIFINHKIHDEDGRYLGVTGLGLDVAATSRLIEDYKTRYDRDIYFVDRSGLIKSHADETLIDRVNIRTQPGLGAVAQTLLSTDQGSLVYNGADGRIFLQYRYIPELDWTLLVEQPERAALAPLRLTLHRNLAASALITLLVLLISAYAIRHFQARLERMATIDKLTGLYNRQTFELLFEAAIANAKRGRQPLSLILYDIDLFKRINDTLGHLAGDAVLKQIARVIARDRRDSDLIARWGGDELVILLPGCDIDAARRIAEQLSQRVSDSVEVPGRDWRIGLSIGIASHREGDNLDAIFARADAELFRAKADRHLADRSQRQAPTPASPPASPPAAD
jgi:diguanylate cyclase (GGDEF)-like protein